MMLSKEQITVSNISSYLILNLNINCSIEIILDTLIHNQYYKNFTMINGKIKTINCLTLYKMINDIKFIKAMKSTSNLGLDSNGLITHSTLKVK